MKGQTFLYLGEGESGRKTDLTLGYKIYLHERGQFWPSPALERLGQSQPVNLETKTLLVGEFQLVERWILNTPARPCVEEESFSFTECLLEFIARRAGCHLDWVGTFNLPDYPPCQSLHQLEQYSDLLDELGDFSWARLTEETGCYGKCHYKEFQFNQRRAEIISWDVNHSSAFYLRAERTAVEVQEEQLVFDWEDLINGIGGALGLFLGWSLLYLGKDLDFSFLH